ncbi:5-formyltetrahydrofolate cyclo-ligase [Nocardioides jiangxiensis]|uniref:5-formyltetrahydrofolate cyclo-ligase n=1 Tax=Nocardioides jiangxiensis TaxID=3064524 RepID=A0ABT9AYN5_9ACTN|nr:5-formyltetrahydrofolate cyclo-ligase [Nocardioides sp. WY-20]MDO7867694.1 5-formyltetrahydrofolate cyclo-ligase [Nocardioides sp. WY-20]
MSEPAATVAKQALRDQLLAARRSLDVATLGAAGRSLAAVVLEMPEVRRAATVAAYVSVGSEPGTGALLEGLLHAGKRVLLPVLLPDNDLDWAVLTAVDELAAARRGLLEPTGPRLGREAIATAEVLLVPGLAVGADGARMGKGGGSYDRALNRSAPDAFVCALLHDGELLASVPSEPHDVPVAAAATPSGVTRF